MCCALVLAISAVLSSLTRRYPNERKSICVGPASTGMSPLGRLLKQSPAGQWVRPFDTIVKPLICPVVRIWCQGFNWFDVATQFVRYDDARLTEPINQPLQKTLGSFGIAVFLNEDIKNITIRVDSPPQPFLAHTIKAKFLNIRTK